MQKFFTDEGKRCVREAVAAVERKSTAEMVVAVRRISGDYRHADYLGGLFVALGALGLFLYWPEPFDFTYFPLEQAAAFVLGSMATSSIGPLRRFMVSDKFFEDALLRSARAAFVELKVGRTEGRKGVLVYVSAFERGIEIVTDAGIDEAALGAPWTDAVKMAQRAVVREGDPKKLAEALKEMGAVLAKAFPKSSGEEDEDEGEGEDKGEDKGEGEGEGEGEDEGDDKGEDEDEDEDEKKAVRS